MGEEEIKVGMITKRAQQKKSFGPVNFKDRVFVLTKSKLAYYEGTETVSKIILLPILVFVTILVITIVFVLCLS